MAGGDLQNLVPASLHQFLRDDPVTSFEMLTDLTGVDYLGHKEPRFEVVYHLYSLTQNHRLRIKVEVEEEEAIEVEEEMIITHLKINSPRMMIDTIIEEMIEETIENMIKETIGEIIMIDATIEEMTIEDVKNINSLVIF